MDTRKAILEATAQADRLHAQFETEARVDAGITRIDVFEMLLSSGIPVMFKPLQGLLGSFVNDGAKGVLITTQRPLSVQRFTAAHELGHAVLNHSTSLDAEETLNRSPFSKSDMNNLQELQANAFASQLLMPNWLVARQMKKHGWSRASLVDPRITYQLSLRLGSSYAATCHALAKYRAIDLNESRKLLSVKPKEIKKSLLIGVEPETWYGDVWLISASDDGCEIEGSKSDHFVLSLVEHTTSGFTWKFDELVKKGVDILNDTREDLGKSDSVGGANRRVVTLSTRSEVVDTIAIQEVRSWSKKTAPHNTLRLNLNLSGAHPSGLLSAQRKALLKV